MKLGSGPWKSLNLFELWVIMMFNIFYDIHSFPWKVLIRLAVQYTAIIDYVNVTEYIPKEGFHVSIDQVLFNCYWFEEKLRGKREDPLNWWSLLQMKILGLSRSGYYDKREIIKALSKSCELPFLPLSSKIKNYQKNMAICPEVQLVLRLNKG